MVSSVPTISFGKHGTVYVYDTATGSLLHTLMSDDIEVDDRFGASIGIYGNTIIIGAPDNDKEEVVGGAAYLFDATTGQQISRFSTGNPTFLDGVDFFGSSVAIGDGVALIARPQIGPDPSGAYLYDLTAGTPPTNIFSGVQIGPEDIGASVVLSGNTAAVGSYRFDVGGPGFHTGEGAVFLFDVTTGNQTGMLVAEDGSDDDRFGEFVAVNGNYALVGGAANNDAGPWNGSAYLFDITTSAQLFQLAPEDGEPLRNFGRIVAINDQYAFVSAESVDRIGMVYMFDLITGAQVHKFTGSDTQVDDQFGASLAIHGNVLVVGAAGVDGANPNSGAAYIFTIPEPAGVMVFAVLGPMVLGRSRRSSGQAGG